jgi:hypothetical protein
LNIFFEEFWPSLFSLRNEGVPFQKNAREVLKMAIFFWLVVIAAISWMLKGWPFIQMGEMVVKAIDKSIEEECECHQQHTDHQGK